MVREQSVVALKEVAVCVLQVQWQVAACLRLGRQLKRNRYRLPGWRRPLAKLVFVRANGGPNDVSGVDRNRILVVVAPFRWDIPSVRRQYQLNDGHIEVRVVTKRRVFLVAPGIQQYAVRDGYAVLVEPVECEPVGPEGIVWYLASAVWQHLFSEDLSFALSTET